MLNPIEEANFAKLKAMCRELKVPAPPEIIIGMKVHDKNGDLIFDDVQRGHSWTRNFYNMMFGSLSDGVASGASFGVGYQTGKNTSGTIRNTVNVIPIRISPTTPGYGMVNNIANANYGIVLGTGDTAFGVEQYVLVTLIAHGNSGSQLYYHAQANGVPAYNGGTKTWKITHTRIFNNNSGGSITVKEGGLYWNGYLYYGVSDNYFMIERSVLSPSVPVPNGAQLTVTYEISMDFSAID